MSLSRSLDALKSETPGCEAVVFGDLQTGTVLWAASGAEMRQEAFDALFDKARACLGPTGDGQLQSNSGSVDASEAADPGPGSLDKAAPPVRAVIISEHTLVLMRRGTPHSQDALALRLDIGAFLSAVWSTPEDKALERVLDQIDDDCRQALDHEE